MSAATAPTQTVQKAIVTLHEARGLKAADADFKSDPYVVVKCGLHYEKTKTIRGTLTPKWEEALAINGLEGRDVIVEVFDSDRTSIDDFLGRVVIAYDEIQKGPIAKRWFKLESAKAGTFKGEISLSVIAE